MSRSRYSDDCEHIELYRGNVQRVIQSKRGQAFLRELAGQMDAMPEKSLIADELISESGECCTLGVVCKSRRIDVSRVDYEDPDSVARNLGINHMLAAEIAFENDEGCYFGETPEARWRRMRKWVADNLQTLQNPKNKEP